MLRLVVVLLGLVLVLVLVLVAVRPRWRPGTFGPAAGVFFVAALVRVGSRDRLHRLAARRLACVGVVLVAAYVRAMVAVGATPALDGVVVPIVPGRDVHAHLV